MICVVCVRDFTFFVCCACVCVCDMFVFLCV